MKVIRFLFSRTFLVIFLILIQIAIVTSPIFITIFIPGYAGFFSFLIVNFIVFLAAIIFYFKIINKKDAPDFKITWITILLLFPLIGVVVYLFFSQRNLSKKDYKILSFAQEQSLKYFEVDVAAKRSNYTDEEKRYFTTFDYLVYSTGLKPFTNNDVKYYKIGEEFFPAFKDELKKAKRFIFMEFFIIDFGKEWNEIVSILEEKAKQGVDVRLLFDDIGCQKLPFNYAKKLREKGIHCYKFNPLRPILSGIFNNRDHRKIAIIDEETAFTGGINLADEYANEIVRFGYWKDAMIKINGPAVKGLIQLFLSVYDIYCDKMSDYDKFLTFDYSKKKYGETITFPFGTGPAPFYTELIGEQTFINLFESAERTIYISSPYLIPTYNLISALRNAAIRGVDVRLMLPGIPDKKTVYNMAKSYFEFLASAGVKIYIYKPGFNHEKAIVVDNKIAFIGTINLDYRSLVHHFECGAILFKGQVVEDINVDLYHCFLHDCDLANLPEKECTRDVHIKNEYRLGLFKRLIISIVNIFAPLL